MKCFKTTTTSWFVFCYVMLSCHAVLYHVCHVMPCRVLSVWSCLVLSCLLSCLVFCALSCVILFCLVLCCLSCFVIGLWYLMLELSLCRFVFVLTCPSFFCWVALYCLVFSYPILPCPYLSLSCLALPCLAFLFFVSCPILSSGRLLCCDCLVLCLVLLFVSCPVLLLWLSCAVLVLYFDGLALSHLGFVLALSDLVSCHFLVILCTQPKPDFSNPYPVRPFSPPASKAKALFLVLWLPYLDE